MALALVLVQFSLVLLNHFHLGSIWLQELLLYINSLMFLGGAGYTFLFDKHVRVDIFYFHASDSKKRHINTLGTLFFLLPLLILLWDSAGPFALTAWKNMEGSVETSGLQAVFLLKSFILIFALGLTVHAYATLSRSLVTILRKEG